MPSERRVVEIAKGHRAKVYRSPRPASRPGFVLVTKSHRQPFEISEECWNKGEIARG